MMVGGGRSEGSNVKTCKLCSSNIYKLIGRGTNVIALELRPLSWLCVAAEKNKTNKGERKPFTFIYLLPSLT